MRTFDLSPLFRSTVGFERLAHLAEAANRMNDQQASYPPYNIEKTGEETYRITMAVAGFGLNDLTLVAQANSVTVTGKVERDESALKVLHRGIAARAFERRFDLADYIAVTGASLDNGLLHIELERQVPEALKPRQIAIAANDAVGDRATIIDQKAA
jgi:molecular chaperone IbpA